jgi:hypothetical protein
LFELVASAEKRLAAIAGAKLADARHLPTAVTVVADATRAGIKQGALDGLQLLRRNVDTELKHR